MKLIKDNPYLHLHTAIFFWGFTGVLGRAIELSAPLIVGYRMILTAIILVILLAFYNKIHLLRINKKDLKSLIGIGILFAIHWVTFYMSIKLAGASIAMICLATASIFTAIFQPLIHKTKLHTNELFMGGLALIGVLIMYIFQNANNPTNPNNDGLQNDFRLGIILGVISAIISAIFTILNKPLSERNDAKVMVFYEMISGFSFLLLLSPLYFSYYHQGAVLPQGWDYLWLFCLVYFCTVLGQQLVLTALKKLNPFVVTLSVNIEPIYGIVLAFLIYQENLMLNWSFYVGMSIIILSLALQVYLSRKKINKKAI